MAPTHGVYIPVASTEEILEHDSLEESTSILEEEYNAVEYEPLAGYIIEEFSKNRDAKTDSDIEKDILNSLKAYNGEYSDEDLARLQLTPGSKIFMNITATKARAAKSWIADILLPPKGKPWSLAPTPIEDLPGDIKKLIEDAISREFQKLVEEKRQPQQPQQQQQQPKVEDAGETLRETNQRKRDIHEAVLDEISAESRFQLSKMEMKIADQLEEGGWSRALLEFIEDFVIFPTAFMKGPVVNKCKGIRWENGEVKETEKFKHKNVRVDPLDIYPSPSAIEVEDGNFCEHMRMTKSDIESLIGVKNYREEALEKVLEDFDMSMFGSWLDTGIEEDKAEQEQRSSYTSQQGDLIHAIHFWGCVPREKLEEWEFYEKIENINPNDRLVEIEAILVGNHVIKCVVNDDPLKRRPYYKASFMNVPGSFWGKSLPNLMSSTQRMCNAVARALSNNLGVASGPQIELYTDRLADAGDISEIVPFKIWQLKSDPTGAGGRAINFWQPTSNAGELLNVYNQFEEKADDVTGIPRYAYGNEKTAGAAQTAQGLAMLFESTSKIIKDCIRNIDEGLIKKRVLYQFHQNMINMPADFNYTGDINVTTIGSNTLSIRGAEASKRNEFLAATANPTDMAVMGTEGRAAILREMAEDLGLSNNVVPSTFELKRKEKKQMEMQQQAAQAQAQAEQAKAQAGIQATTVQIEGQKAMHQQTMQAKIAQMQADMQKHQEKMQVEIAKIQRQMKADNDKTTVAAVAEENKSKRQNQEVALKLKKGEGI